MLKRLLSIALVVLLLPLGAAHSLSLPFDEGQGIKAQITGEIKKWNAFKGPTLETFQQWALNSRMVLETGGDTAQATLYYLDSPLLQYIESPEGTLVQPGGTLYTGSKENLHALLGEELVDVSPFSQGWALLTALKNALPKLPPLLSQYEKVVKEGITIKNVGKATQKVEYALTAMEWNALWPRIADVLVQEIRLTLPHDPLADQAETFLRGLVFEEKGTFKRFLDKSGKEMGWQMTGTLSLMGQDARKVTLYGGYAEDGLYISIKLPALRGKNDFTLALSYTNEKGKIKLDGNYRRALNGQANTLALALSLNTQKGLSGKITVTQGETGQKNTVWTLTPKLLWADSALDGTMGVARKKGTRELSLLLNLSLSPGAAPNMPAFTETVALDTLDEDALTAARQELHNRLAQRLWPLVTSVPEENRMLVLHEMGRHLRVNGPTISTETQNDYLVTKEEQIP